MKERANVKSEEEITTLEAETRRMEVIGVELDTKEVLVEFQFDGVFVSFGFRESDLPMLKKMVAELEKEFTAWDKEEASST